jgi:hypothetical protein
MTFQHLLDFAFPSGAPDDCRFTLKSSLESGARRFLPEQVMSKVFSTENAEVWLDIEKLKMDFNDIF